MAPDRNKLLQGCCVNAVAAIRLLDSLKQRLCQCSEDELAVVDILLARLELGRERYGFLDLSKPRDWDREEAEEWLDAAIYRACKTVAQREREQCEAADKFAANSPVEFGLNEFLENTPAEFGGES